MAEHPKKPGSEPNAPSNDGEGGEGFDAIKAAEELAASIGLSPSEEERSSDRYAATLEDEIEQLNLLLDQRDAELARTKLALERVSSARDQAQDEIARASARIERELSRQNEQKLRDILLTFIEINDDLDRAIEAASTSEKAETILEGVELVQRSFERKLAELGVASFNPAGEPFDPNLHEAVTTIATDDPDQAGTVLAVIRVGYTIGSECLRPARVGVGKLVS